MLVVKPETECVISHSASFNADLRNFLPANHLRVEAVPTVARHIPITCGIYGWPWQWHLLPTVV